MEAYKECRELPGDEFAKAQFCAKYAEHSEAQLELEAKLAEVKYQKIAILTAIMKPQ
ncbi:hypothetical protein [Gilvimarinus sp. F26214L]